MFDTLEQAIEAARDAQQAVLLIEATDSNRTMLDASYNALSESIRQLSKLLECTVVE